VNKEDALLLLSDHQCVDTFRTYNPGNFLTLLSNYNTKFLRTIDLEIAPAISKWPKPGQPKYGPLSLKSICKAFQHGFSKFKSTSKGCSHCFDVCEQNPHLSHQQLYQELRSHFLYDVEALRRPTLQAGSLDVRRSDGGRTIDCGLSVGNHWWSHMSTDRNTPPPRVSVLIFSISPHRFSIFLSSQFRLFLMSVIFCVASRWTSDWHIHPRPTWCGWWCAAEHLCDSTHVKARMKYEINQCQIILFKSYQVMKQKISEQAKMNSSDWSGLHQEDSDGFIQQKQHEDAVQETKTPGETSKRGRFFETGVRSSLSFSFAFTVPLRLSGRSLPISLTRFGCEY
jgi:hypothetical protein